MALGGTERLRTQATASADPCTAPVPAGQARTPLVALDVIEVGLRIRNLLETRILYERIGAGRTA